MFPALLERAGRRTPIEGPGIDLGTRCLHVSDRRAVIVYPDDAARDAALSVFLAARHPALPTPWDAFRINGRSCLSFPPVGGDPFVAPIHWEDGSRDRLVERLSSAVAAVHATGRHLGGVSIDQLRLGTPEMVAPAWFIDLDGRGGSSAADWRDLAVILQPLASTITQASIHTMAQGQAPSRIDSPTPGVTAVPRSLAAWYAAAIAGRQGPTVLPAVRCEVAGAFALRCAARGALVVSVDAAGGDGLAEPLRASLAQVLSPTAAARLGVQRDPHGLLAALREASEDPVLLILRGLEAVGPAERSIVAFKQEAKGSGVAVLLIESAERGLDNGGWVGRVAATGGWTGRDQLAEFMGRSTAESDLAIEKAVAEGSARWQRVGDDWLVVARAEPTVTVPALRVSRSHEIESENDDVGIRDAFCDGQVDRVHALLKSRGIGSRRAWAAHMLDLPATEVGDYADTSLARGDRLEPAALAGLAALRVVLHLEVDEMASAFGLADQLLRIEDEDPAVAGWLALTSARVDHEVATPIGASVPALLEAVGAHRKVSQPFDHAGLLAETLELLVLAGETSLAQQGLDGARTWLRSLPHSIADWLHHLAERLGLLWPEVGDSGVDEAFIQAAAALTKASSPMEVAAALADVLGRLSGRLITVVGSNELGLRLSALPGFRFAGANEGDATLVGPLDVVVEATLERLAKKDALHARIGRLYAAVLKAVELTDILPALVSCLVTELGAERGQIVVVDSAGAAVHSAGSVRGYSATLLGVLQRQTRSIVLPDVMEDPRMAESASAIYMGLRGVLLGPIRYEGQLVGAVLLEGTDFKRDAPTVLDGLIPHLRAPIAGMVERRLPSEPLAQLPSAIHALGFVAAAPAMEPVVAVIEQVAHLDVPVLVLGETGTGKEVVVRALYANSPRSKGPFQAIDCGALPENILEGELFGYRKGAFTGAIKDSPGLFRAAEGGVLFLDEIAEMSLEVQKRLLRVLQEREVQPLGGGNAVAIDVRILAATHQDLREAVAVGRFREDLFYRLRVIEIQLPPLRDRIVDVPGLTRVLLDRAAERVGVRTPGLERSALKALMLHRWPGNVRELEHTLMRACALCRDGVIQAKDLDLVDSSRSAVKKVPSEGLDRRSALLSYSEGRVSFSCREWAEEAGVSVATALRDLKQLVAEGILSRSGQRRAARYART